MLEIKTVKIPKLYSPLQLLSASGGQTKRLPKELNIIAAEMESFAIFYIAKLLGKEAACLLTIVDSLYKKEELSAEERQNSLDNMTILALESIL